MKLLVTVLLIVLVYASNLHINANYVFETKYIDVPIDHFSFTNNFTFKLKYLVNSTYWAGGGPIFFYTGNEGAIETFAQNTGFMFDIANAFGALIVFSEHRYYGESLPFGNDSFSSVAHLGYLTSSQALADFVDVINQLQSTYNKFSYLEKLPVVAFGGSYGGMLAAWLRLKYPWTVIGSIASSAPIWQFQGLTPCENFNRVVTNVYTYTESSDCSRRIAKIWTAIRTITATDDGKSWLTSQWKLCRALKSNSDIDALIDWFTNIVVNLAMVNYPYPTSFLAPLPPNPVRAFCQRLDAAVVSDDKSLITGMAAALGVYTNYTNTAKCNDINTTSPNIGEMQWDFQACTEIIMPMCSTDDDMFENEPWDFDKYVAACAKKFGIEQRRDKLPIFEYGGKDLTAASNIVFSNGLLDPWATGGVLRNISSKVMVVIMPDAAHHLDLRAANKLDPPSVIDARNIHINQIRKWIDEFYHENNSQFFRALPIYERIINIPSNNL